MGRALLRADALRGVRLGISVSESADLSRLGLLEEHFRLALAEITRCVLVAGGQLAYGGRLGATGYTAFIMSELERYARRDRPFKSYLAWSVHRNTPLTDIGKAAESLGLHGEICCLDLDGNVLDDVAAGRDEAPVPADAETQRRSLTALRTFMADKTQGRVFVGGKRSGFSGEMPGLLEEAIFAVGRGQPVYLAGGFGGITSDIARELAVNDGSWLPTLPDAARDERVARGMAKLVAAAQANGNRSLTDNGLTAKENQELSVTHRPGEIASWISLGLGRHFARNTAPVR